MPFIVGPTADVAVDLASDRCDHSDASVARGRWRNCSKTLAIPYTVVVRNNYCKASMMFTMNVLRLGRLPILYRLYFTPLGYLERVATYFAY